MSFQRNEMSTDRLILTGLANIRIHQVNPTAEAEAEFFGRDKAGKEPVYTGLTNRNDASYLRLVFLCSTPFEDGEHKFKVNFNIYDEEVNPSTGKVDAKGNPRPDTYQFVTSSGYVKWVESQEAHPDYGVEEDIRRALKGESDLMEFLSKYYNLQKGSHNILVNWEEVKEGDLSSITETLEEFNEQFPDATVKGLLGASNGYQDVYTRNFLKSNEFPKADSYFTRQVLGLRPDGTKTTYGWKADFGGSFELQQWTPTPVTVDSLTGVAGSPNPETPVKKKSPFGK